MRKPLKKKVAPKKPVARKPVAKKPTPRRRKMDAPKEPAKEPALSKEALDAQQRAHTTAPAQVGAIRHGDKIEITDIKWKDGVAVATTKVPHKLVTGNRLNIKGSLQPEFNVPDAVITVVNTSSFSYICQQAPAPAPASAIYGLVL